MPRIPGPGYPCSLAGKGVCRRIAQRCRGALGFLTKWLQRHRMPPARRSIVGWHQEHPVPWLSPCLVAELYSCIRNARPDQQPWGPFSPGVRFLPEIPRDRSGSDIYTHVFYVSIRLCFQTFHFEMIVDSHVRLYF